MVSSPTVSWRMIRLRITSGATSTSTNMMKVEPSLPWRSNNAWSRFDVSAMTTSTTPIAKPRAPDVRRVEGEEQHGSEEHADEETTPEAAVVGQRR